MIIEFTAGSLSDIITGVKSVRSEWNPTRLKPEEIWFRGQSKYKYQLLPGLYRHNMDKYDYNELAMFEAYKALAAAFVSPRPELDWEWYFLAQHYRMPTRLLDWTENVLVATYFAIADCVCNIDRTELDLMANASKNPSLFDEDSPAVWIVDAGTLNLSAFGDDYDAIFASPSDIVNPYLPEAITEDPPEVLEGFNNDVPIAIYPPRSNPRIVAQQGVFTVHGRSRVAIENLPAAGKAGAIKLARISLDKNNLAPIWDELGLAGVTRLTLFPELESVAAHVRWSYQN